MTAGAAVEGRAGALERGPTAEQEFVAEVVQGGQAEIGLSKLASERARNRDVRDFAERLVRDHTQAHDVLMTVAAQMKWVVPRGPSKKHKADEQRLGRLSGDRFDRAYLQQMVKDHQRDLRMLEEALRRMDGVVRDWIERTLPSVQQHLDGARSLAARLEPASPRANRTQVRRNSSLQLELVTVYATPTAGR
jgi:putative membrane protein